MHVGRGQIDSAGDHGGTSGVGGSGAGAARESDRWNCDRRRMGGIDRTRGMALLSRFRKLNSRSGEAPTKTGLVSKDHDLNKEWPFDRPQGDLRPVLR